MGHVLLWHNYGPAFQSAAVIQALSTGQLVCMSSMVSHMGTPSSIVPPIAHLVLPTACVMHSSHVSCVAACRVAAVQPHYGGDRGE
jgi:hypothetical protein